MAGPIIKVLKGPSPTQVGVSNAAVSGLGSLISAISYAAELYPHDDESLLDVLHHRIQIALNATRRSRWIGGRVFNRLSGEDPDYIPMSDTQLLQTLAIVGADAHEVVSATGKYQLRLDVSKEARDLLVKKREQS